MEERGYCANFMLFSLTQFSFILLLVNLSVLSIFLRLNFINLGSLFGWVFCIELNKGFFVYGLAVSYPFEMLLFFSLNWRLFIWRKAVGLSNETSFILSSEIPLSCCKFSCQSYNLNLALTSLINASARFSGS